MSEFINTVDVVGDETLTDSIIDRSITEFKDNSVTKIGTYAFTSCTALTEIDLPNVVTIRKEAFYNCSQLVNVSLPNLTRLPESYVFKGCTSLVSIDLPKLTTNSASVHGIFQNCAKLESVNLPLVEIIGPSTFSAHFGSAPIISKLDLPCCTQICADAMSMSTLEILILRASTVCTLDNVNALNSTKIKAGTGFIYVPSALVDGYKAATNWSTYADQFRALEDYTVDGTTSGEIDETKI